LYGTKYGMTLLPWAIIASVLVYRVMCIVEGYFESNIFLNQKEWPGHMECVALCPVLPDVLNSHIHGFYYNVQEFSSFASGSMVCVCSLILPSVSQNIGIQGVENYLFSQMWYAIGGLRCDVVYNDLQVKPTPWSSGQSFWLPI
jgi:hypothetical protein